MEEERYHLERLARSRTAATRAVERAQIIWAAHCGASVYLNRLEPWWKVLRSLALKGCRFETWEQIVEAVTHATVYWNAHEYPFVWGRQRRHQQRCRPGITMVPGVR